MSNDRRRTERRSGEPRRSERGAAVVELAMIAPILILIVITMQCFALFQQIDVMTNGGPLDATQTVVFQAVERGYGKQDISGGSTISVLLFLIVLTISLVQRWLTRER